MISETSLWSLVLNSQQTLLVLPGGEGGTTFSKEQHVVPGFQLESKCTSPDMHHTFLAEHSQSSRGTGGSDTTAAEL